MRTNQVITILAAIAFTASYTPTAGAQALTADDYCSISKTTPKGVKAMHPMADGESYTAISDDGKSIDVYSYRTGKKTSTLFSVDGIKGAVKISDFEGYSISANEKKILLWNESEKVYRYSFYAEYYVYDIMRSTMKRVSTSGKQRGAVISHDGRMVAYQRDNNVFISNNEYDTDVAVTKDGKRNEIIYGTPDWVYEEEFSILNTLCWSADDNTLAFLKFDESQVPVYSFDNYRSFCDADPLGDPYPEPFSYKYPLAGYNNSVVDVLAYDVNTRKIKVMDIPMAPTDYVPVLKFAKGSNDRLMAMVLNRDQNDLKLYSVNPGSTVARLIYTDTSKAWLSPSAYQMCSFKENSFVIGSDRSGYRHLYQYDYNGNLQRQLTKGEFYVTEYYGSDALGTHYFQCTKLGAINRNVARVDAKGVMTLQTPGKEGTEKASFSRGCKYYLRRYSNALTPPQYTLCNQKGETLATLETNDTYASFYQSAPKKEFLKVKNAVGEEMDAYIIKPTNFSESKKYPLLIYQYNGPESQLVLNSWSIDGLYWFAQEGYIVVCVDGRGTGCRSRAWSDAVYKRLGQVETDDQIAGVRYFGSLPYVDEKRMACFGWSYGGYMTLMELTSPENPFVAGVSMAPVTDWRYYDSIYTERYMLTPQQNEEGYNIASALARTNKLNSRLLIMSGTSDDNVHFYNTLKYTSKLNYEGKIFDMMALTGFEHSLRMCNARTMLYRKIGDFLDTYVKNVK